jgi:hypothetical protein
MARREILFRQGVEIEIPGGYAHGFIPRKPLKN